MKEEMPELADQNFWKRTNGEDALVSGLRKGGGKDKGTLNLRVKVENLPMVFSGSSKKHVFFVSIQKSCAENDQCVIYARIQTNSIRALPLLSQIVIEENVEAGVKEFVEDTDIDVTTIGAKKGSHWKRVGRVRDICTHMNTNSTNRTALRFANEFCSPYGTGKFTIFTYTDRGYGVQICER